MAALTSSERNKIWRKNNPKRKAEYARKYNREHAEQVAQYGRSYRSSHLEEKRVYDKKYRKANPEKRRAPVYVHRACKSGELVRAEICSRPSCTNTERIEAHHEDYSKPLDVEWLCESCHKKHHNPKLVVV